MELRSRRGSRFAHRALALVLFGLAIVHPRATEIERDE
jgi:hypothetical protein